MKRNRLLFAGGGILFLLVFATLSVQAAEEGGGAGAEGVTEVFKWINFAIVAGVVLWFCLKKAPAFFARRAAAVTAAITKATAEKAGADQQLREAETKLGNLEKEVADLRAFAERESAAEAVRIRNATQSDTQKIAAAARAEIEAAERGARLELKALAARLAVEGAELLLVKQLTAKVQGSLISNFVKSLEGRPN